ncbi:MAG: four-carbon acid sugar kinase family protein [Christensenella sp.]|nr:four-carbon acid sugar kinase family protein [Christensenella sp.]
MAQLLLLADDFTGALDGGVQFAKRGCGVFVSTDGNFPEEGDTDVIVMDLESRHLLPVDAYEKVYEKTEYAANRCIPFLYKKTDSTLRGNVGAELEAALRASGREQLFFIPAFPRMGRTVENGVFYVNGTLLTETSYAKDPFQPISSNVVTEIIGAQTNLPVRRCDWKTDRIPQTGEKTIWIFDAYSEKDIAELADVLYPAATRAVFAGCAGFAEYMAYWLEKKAGKKAVCKTKEMRQVMLCGSINERTRRQISYAVKQKAEYYKLKPEDYLAPCVPEDTRSRLKEKIANSRAFMLYTAEKEDDIAAAAQYAQTHGIEKNGLHLRIAEGLGRIAAICLAQKETEVFSVVGGDTLFGTVRGAKIKNLTLCKEALPGVILSRIVLEDGTGKYMFSKAGSFGEEDVLWKMLQYFIE